VDIESVDISKHFPCCICDAFTIGISFHTTSWIKKKEEESREFQVDKSGIVS